MVRPGETVDIRTAYALLTPSQNREEDVTEKWEITHNGQRVGNSEVTVLSLIDAAVDRVETVP